MLASSLVRAIQQADRPVEVEGGAVAGEVEIELHHGNGDIGLNANHDRRVNLAVMAMDRNERLRRS